MATLDEVLAAVKAENERLASIDALVAGLQKQIAEALSGVSPLPPAVQEKVDSVFSMLQANKALIDEALNTGTPAPEVPAPAPAPGTPAPETPAPGTEPAPPGTEPAPPGTEPAPPGTEPAPPEAPAPTEGGAT